MALTINTNISSLVAQRNLTNATTSLNKAIERMTTGYKINHAADNAAGFAIARNWETQISSLDVAADNAATGADMLTTLEDTYSLVTSHVQRVRDLTEQAANGTYGEQSLKAIQSEIESRLAEIDRISANCDFNGRKMMDGSIAQDIALQVGIDGSANSQITLTKELFKSSKVADIFTAAGLTGATAATVAQKCTGLKADGTIDAAVKPADMLTTLDKVLSTINDRVTTLGAAQNRIESALESIDVQSENITSSLSTLKDADIANESSEYIKSQILQQAAATLLSTANQTPSIALNLI